MTQQTSEPAIADFDKRIAYLQEHRRVSATTDNEFLRLTVELGMAAVKGSMLINGGAAVALLAFLGSTYKPGAPSATWAAHALAWFAMGTLVSALVGGLSYVCQFFYAHARTEDEATMLALFPQDPSASAWQAGVQNGKRLQRWAVGLNWAAALVYVACFFMGAKKAFDGF